MLRNNFYDSLKRILFAFFAMLFFAPAFSATLPAGYTELEYIESTGTQWIDTGIVPNANLKVTGAFAITDISASRNYIVGVTNGGTGRFQFSYSAEAFFGFGSNYDRPALSPNTNNHIFEADKNAFKIDGGTVYTPSSTSFTGDKTMVMFASRDSNGVTTFGKEKVYDLQMYDNGTLVRDFVPAKNASGVIGMYDTVRNEFYTNQGTGSFTAGPIACPNGGTLITYESANGTVSRSGTPSPTNPIEPVFYTQGNMVLRKVGDYADSYDAATGKITRRVGVKVMNGTEDWFLSANGSNYLGNMYNLFINDMFAEASSVTSNRQSPYSTHFARSTNWISNSAETRLNKVQAYTPSDGIARLGVGYRDVSDANIPAFKSWLAEQYAAGTPVIVYYPLKTSVTEDWPVEQCESGNLIKIATTKYNEDAFANLVTTLNSAITKVTNIVDTTVAQATSIGTLATTKQDRPADGDCPTGRKCLLVTGADGKPHWYLIQE